MGVCSTKWQVKWGNLVDACIDLLSIEKLVIHKNIHEPTYEKRLV